MVLHSFQSGFDDLGELKADLIFFSPKMALEFLELFRQIFVILAELNSFSLVLTQLCLEVLMSMLVAIDLVFQAQNVRLALDDLLLSVPHVFVLLDLGFYDSDFFLDGFTKLSQELNSVMNVFIFALLQFGDVTLDMLVVEP